MFFFLVGYAHLSYSTIATACIIYSDGSQSGIQEGQAGVSVTRSRFLKLFLVLVNRKEPNPTSSQNITRQQMSVGGSLLVVWESLFYINISQVLRSDSSDTVC